MAKISMVIRFGMTMDWSVAKRKYKSNKHIIITILLASLFFFASLMPILFELQNNETAATTNASFMVLLSSTLLEKVTVKGSLKSTKTRRALRTLNCRTRRR